MKHYISVVSPAFAQPKLATGYFYKKRLIGLEVVVIENSKVPLATIEIAVKNGAYTKRQEFSELYQTPFIMYSWQGPAYYTDSASTISI